MDVVAHPYIYYLAQVIENLQILTVVCSALCFAGAAWSLMTTTDIERVMKYNEVFKNEEVNIAQIIKENDEKIAKVYKYNIAMIILIFVTLIIPNKETAYYILLNL